VRTHGRQELTHALGMVQPQRDLDRDGVLLGLEVARCSCSDTPEAQCDDLLIESVRSDRASGLRIGSCDRNREDDRAPAQVGADGGVDQIGPSSERVRQSEHAVVIVPLHGRDLDLDGAMPDHLSELPQAL
jgi:hypothetical protein